MKKFLSVLLGMILVLNLTACTDSKESLLQFPYGLEFGMSYDELCDALTDNGFEAPHLDESTYHNGFETLYISETETTNFDWEFLHSKSLVESPKIDSTEYLDFELNENKEMYAFTCHFIGGLDESVLNEIKAYFNENFNVVNTNDKHSFISIAEWENEEMYISMYDHAGIMFEFHSFEYDMDY